MRRLVIMAATATLFAATAGMAGVLDPVTALPVAPPSVSVHYTAALQHYVNKKGGTKGFVVRTTYGSTLAHGDAVSAPALTFADVVNWDSAVSYFSNIDSYNLLEYTGLKSMEFEVNFADTASNLDCMAPDSIAGTPAAVNLTLDYSATAAGHCVVIAN